MAGNKYLTNNGGRYDEARSAQLSSDSATASGALVALNSAAKIDASLLPHQKGQATLVNGTVTVTANPVSSSSVIILTIAQPGSDGTVGVLSIGAIVTNTSFTINSTYSTDSAVVNWVIL